MLFFSKAVQIQHAKSCIHVVAVDIQMLYFLFVTCPDWTPSTGWLLLILQILSIIFMSWEHYRERLSDRSLVDRGGRVQKDGGEVKGHRRKVPSWPATIPAHIKSTVVLFITQAHENFISWRLMAPDSNREQRHRAGIVIRHRKSWKSYFLVHWDILKHTSWGVLGEL